MRFTFRLLPGILLVSGLLSYTAGCSDNTTVKASADQDEIAQWLAENPEYDVDVEEEEDDASGDDE